MATKLKFRDFKTQKNFTTDKFTIVRKGGRTSAKTIAPSGVKASVFVKKGFKK